MEFLVRLGLTITPWSWALLEKRPVEQLLKNFPTFYGTRRFHRLRPICYFYYVNVDSGGRCPELLIMNHEKVYRLKRNLATLCTVQFWPDAWLPGSSHFCNCYNPSRDAGCNIREYGTSHQPVPPGRGKPILCIFCNSVISTLPRYELAKFLFLSVNYCMICNCQFWASCEWIQRGIIYFICSFFTPIQLIKLYLNPSDSTAIFVSP
jgi:hypothetical protein